MRTVLKNKKIPMLVLCVMLIVAMAITGTACGNSGSDKEESPAPAESTAPADDAATEDTPAAEGSSDWQSLLAEYEAWVDEYVVLLEKYKKDPTDTSILDDYTEMSKKAEEWSAEMTTLQGNLTSDDLAAYTEELTKITEKLTKALQ